MLCDHKLNCNDNQYRKLCDNKICNGIVDCIDGSDEYSCNGKTKLTGTITVETKTINNHNNNGEDGSDYDNIQPNAILQSRNMQMSLLTILVPVAILCAILSAVLSFLIVIKFRTRMCLSETGDRIGEQDDRMRHQRTSGGVHNLSSHVTESCTIDCFPSVITVPTYEQSLNLNNNQLNAFYFPALPPPPYHFEFKPEQLVVPSAPQHASQTINFPQQLLINNNRGTSQTQTTVRDDNLDHSASQELISIVPICVFENIPTMQALGNEPSNIPSPSCNYDSIDTNNLSNTSMLNSIREWRTRDSLLIYKPFNNEAILPTTKSFSYIGTESKSTQNYSTTKIINAYNTHNHCHRNDLTEDILPNTSTRNKIIEKEKNSNMVINLYGEKSRGNSAPSFSLQARAKNNDIHDIQKRLKSSNLPDSGEFNKAFSFVDEIINNWSNELSPDKTNVINTSKFNTPIISSDVTNPLEVDKGKNKEDSNSVDFDQTSSNKQKSVINCTSLLENEIYTKGKTNKLDGESNHSTPLNSLQKKTCENRADSSNVAFDRTSLYGKKGVNNYTLLLKNEIYTIGQTNKLDAEAIHSTPWNTLHKENTNKSYYNNLKNDLTLYN